MAHMKRHNLISNKQYGFITGRSTMLQLIQVLDKWTEAIDEGEAVDVVYCDFMKAFDKVSHKRLLSKVEGYRIEGNILRWIKSFLTSRRQCVMVNGEASEWREVTSLLAPFVFVENANLNARVYLSMARSSTRESFLSRKE